MLKLFESFLFGRIANRGDGIERGGCFSACGGYLEVSCGGSDFSFYGLTAGQDYRQFLIGFQTPDRCPGNGYFTQKLAFKG